MNATTKSRKTLLPEEVKRDNSNLFRHSCELAAELHKLRFRKSRPELYNNYCAVAGDDGLSDPFADMDFRLDIERFTESLQDVRDKLIFQAFLLGKFRQVEVAELIGCCQATVSNRTRNLIERFAEFYKEDR